MIDVIIPAYNSSKYLDNVLSSLSLQTIKDKIKVTIVNDGSNDDYTDIVSLYKKYISIELIGYKENKGPGFARKYGINNTNNKYIIFIDSDDVLYDKFSIENLYNTIEGNNLDYVNSIFYEEIDGDLYPKEEDNTWLHGKIYRRSFLVDNNINFNDTRSNEDNGFNALVQLSNPRKEYIKTPTYIWKSNMDSITRKNNYEYQYTGLFGFIENIEWALKIKEKDEKIKYDIAKMALQSLYYLYLCYLSFQYKENSEEIIKKSKKLYNYSKFYDFNKYEYTMVLEEEFKRNYDYFDKSIIFDPSITFSSFLKKVGDYND